MADVNSYIDGEMTRFHEELFEFLRIPSVSARSEHSGDMGKTAAWVAGQIREAGLEASIIETPGHSPGSVSLHVGNLLFAGDALFQGSIGRTDLPGGDHDTLLESIRSELLVLPDDTIVYPGHGPSTTIGQERRTNPFLI